MIPTRLVEREVAHAGLTELHVVDTMHERKALMAELSDALIALPGGSGTLDELFELFTWTQLGLHRKPIGLLDVADYWQPLLAFLDHAVNERFLRAEHLETLLVRRDAAELLDRAGLVRAPSRSAGGSSAGSRSGRAEHAVAGVAQTRADIGVLVELAVDRGRPDRHLGVLCLDGRDPLGRGDQADQLELPRPRPLELVKRRTALPPVASIGSSTYTRASGSPGGSRS